MYQTKHLRLGISFGLVAWTLAAQTQLDLRTQTKSVDFQGASMTRPLRTSALLPATCMQNELILLTTAPAGSNIYVCLTPNNWVPQGGTPGAVTIQNSNTPVGARGTQNYSPGVGMLNVITDTGTKINIQQTVDTAFVVSKGALQSGEPLICQSASASATTYTCAMSPTLTTYTTAMVVNWRPDVSNSGTATVNIDLLAAVPVRKADGTTNLAAGDVVARQLYQIWYDGTVFRMVAAATASGGTSGPPAAITSTTSGGTTVLTATTEWHSPLAYCSGATTATLVWNVPPTGAAAATADGCTGTGVSDAYAAFTPTGTPSLQTSFMLPKTLTGTADVYLTYLSPTASGTFTPAMDLVCTPANATTLNDGVFTANNFFAPGALIAPATANLLGTASATALAWPSACTAGSRAHLRLIRTDTGGTATKISVAEVVMVMRRTM